ncbi:inorganic diphosphatase [Streptomyces sp. GZWMJZ-114]|uniref:inorganic diphosphatase n=1 Tax=Streptomyces sp. GZWMJZ-114 TaxID=2494734 RepID=UPI001011F604|nr:inorganic diphosphatase [Streptomyces sp. GZWMJZ-114]
MEFDVTVEVPAGTRNKYEMDHTTHRIRLDRRLFTSVRYPTEYGFVEDSLGRDGDPLDALVLTGEPTFPGCLIRSRAIGMFVMSDENGPDEKVLCVPARDRRYAALADIDDVPAHLLDEIAHFFRVYKQLEPDKHVETSHWTGTEAAVREIANAYRRVHDAA